GLFGLIAPRYTAAALDLEPAGTTMGLSEMRASAGGLFVALGAFCMLSGADWAFAALGIAYAGSAVGRVTSIVLDQPPMPKAFVWFLFELLPAVWLISVNL
ncbi:MAG: DUF4345 family protein, partial [Paracoccaceae bacterium]